MKIQSNRIKFKRFSGKRFTKKIQRWTWSDQFELELFIAVIEFWMRKFGPYPQGVLCQYGCLRSCPYLFLYPNCPYMLTRDLWREIVYANY